MAESIRTRLAAQGRRGGIKESLLEQFYPADPDWRAMVGLRTRQIWAKGLLALSTEKPE